MDSVREVKNRVGHGGICTPRKKLAMIRSTGLAPSSAMRSAAQGMENTERAARVTFLGGGHVHKHGIGLLPRDPVHGRHGSLRVLELYPDLGLPDQVDDAVGTQLHRPLAAVDN